MVDMLRDKTCMTTLVNGRRSIVAPAIVQHPLHIPSESMDRAVAQVLAMVHAETAEAVQHEKRKPEDAKTEERNVQPRIATSPSPPLTQRPSPPSKSPPVDPRTDPRTDHHKTQAKSVEIEIPENILDCMANVFNIKFIVREAETDVYYASYLDNEIDAINKESSLRNDLSMDDLIQVYLRIRDYAYTISDKVDALIDRAKEDTLEPMSEARCSWCKHAKEIAQELVEVLKPEISKQVFPGSSDEDSD